MLSLWSRVAQIRGSCRCPQCLSAAQGVARSAGTSAARRPQYWTSSTLWYSGIFAAAASWDALYKVQRREKWDQAIAEIKDELREYDGMEDVLSRQTLEQVQQERKGRAKYGYTLNELAVNFDDGRKRRFNIQPAKEVENEEDYLGNVTVLEGNAALQGLVAGVSNGSENTRPNDHSSARDYEVENGNPIVLAQDEALQEIDSADGGGVKIFEGDEALQQLAANLDSSSRRRSRPQWPANTGSDANPHWLPPQSIYAPHWFKRRHEFRGWAPYKVERCMVSTDLFLLKTWEELQKRGTSVKASKAVPSAYAKYITMPEDDLRKLIAQKEADLDRLERIGAARFDAGQFRRSEADVPLCRYHVDDHGDFHDSTREMNQWMRTLFEQTEADSHTIPALMAKICYRLSLSTSPPNIDTYNTLLVGLFNCRQVRHTENVIHSMLRTRARPNEVTLATVLNFHTATGDAGNFRWWVQRMRGEFGGLMNASPHTTISHLTRNRLVHYDNGKNDGLGTIVQLPYPTPMVFGALIRGVLSFSGFEAALSICESMAHEGWSLCITGLGTMLRDCTDRKDWISGLTVWKQIQALKWKSTNYFSSKWTSETIGLQTFIAMLQLCSRCGQRSVFEIVMEQAIKAHPNALTDIIKSVRTDKPVVRDLNMEGIQEPTSLDAIAPAWKPPIDEAALTLQSMPDEFSSQLNDTGDDIVVDGNSQSTGLDDLRDYWQEVLPYPVDEDGAIT